MGQKYDSGHKAHFFLKVKPIFRRYISEFDDLFPSWERNFVMSYLQD